MARKKPLSREAQEFLDALPVEAQPLLETTAGPELVQELGMDVVRGVVLDVLRGVNIRDSTEMLTRKRLSLLNAALISQYVKMPGSQSSIEEFLSAVEEAIVEARLNKGQKWVLYWTLGLNEKAVQNVLRDDHLALSGYIERYLGVLREAADIARRDFGDLSGTLRIGDTEVPLDWFFILYFSAGIGAQTLTIRGADKSLYGKLFEKLVLGSVLSVLGFRFSPSGPTDPSPGQFWLSTTSKRESDATLLIESGRGVRFDIGFIGRGNPEITLDKVSRFEREAEFSNRRYGMSTFIIVDRIGTRSKLEELASQIDGTVIQMSLSYWPQVLARHLSQKFEGYSDELIEAEQHRTAQLIEERLAEAPLEDLLRKAGEEGS